MSKRIYNCNFEYFKTIDTEDKAYWLGFIYADGCLHDDTRPRKLKTKTSIQNRKYLTLCLSVVDRDHLVKFVQDIGGNYPIRDYSDKYGHKYSVVCIEHIDVFNNLSSHGLTPRKTFVLDFPEIREALKIHFIRGFFDGDGCISKHKTRYSSGSYEFEINITGTFEMLTSIQNNLPVNSMRKFSKRYPEKENNDYTFRCSGNQQVYRILNLLYENANVYLSRKYEKYLELKQIICRPD